MTQNIARQSARLPDGFLQQSLFAYESGLSSQVIEDKEFTGDRITIRGQELYNFGLCSYLGLSDDPRLIEGAIDAIRRYGNSYSSSIAYTSLPLYDELKERLSAMIGAQVLVAGTTTLAHMAALPVLVRSGDLVLVDRLAHASLLGVIPTLQARRAKLERIPHNDLELVAERARKHDGPVWYVIDGLYSMHGDQAPARELRELIERTPSLWIYCDDAHGFSWSGERGRGRFLDDFGWHPRLVMSYGLSKSFGALGGVVAAQDSTLIKAIEITGGPMVFGGPVPPASLGAGVVSGDLHLSGELSELQRDLSTRIDFVNDYAERIGLPLSAREHSPLWFVEVGGTSTTASVGARIMRDGYFVNVATYPVVGKGHSGIRFTVTRYNTISQIRGLLESINHARLRYEKDEDVLDLTAFE
ncbi:MAG TPA: aminotransferase class I/II-fold pyridoxal phosphate-dependent enzyme [Acidimicrobiia bacterium]|nr:aminotransferase class I/II-fold pyridoxal phosphate-dependent enzyme [Acidimicrobiia bacterium]